MNDNQKVKTRTSKGPKRSEETHSAILSAAQEILSEGGPSALSFEAVARKAKAGKPTIYRWWPNKTALLLEIYSQQKLENLEIPNLGSLREDLIAWTKQLWNLWRDTTAGPIFAALLAEAQSTKETQEVLAEHFFSSNHGPSVICFKRAFERGELNTENDLSTLRKAYVSLNWFHLLCGRLDDKVVEPSIDLLLNGALKR